jgi:hypothetical protein
MNILVRDSKRKIARLLIQRSGGNVKAAHEMVSLEGKQLKRPRGKPSYDDARWLRFAADIQQREHCSDIAALEEMAACCKTVTRNRRRLFGDCNTS